MTVADLLRAIKRHWLLELILFVITVGITVAYTLTAAPVYSASSQLMVKVDTTGSSQTTTGSSSAASSAAASLSSFAQLAQSDAVLEPVIDNLGLHTTVSDLRNHVSAETAEDGGPFMTVSVSYGNADDTVSILDEVTKQLNKQVKSSASALLQLDVMQKPVKPTQPFSPNVGANIAIGAVAGIIIAVLGAMVRDLFDNKIHDRAEIQQIIEAPILASIPRSPTVAGHTPAIIVKPRGHAAEAFRRLATNLTFVMSSNVSDNANLLIVTSSGPREGKTTVSTNLAAAFAEKGESVLLIDADARHPSVAKALGLSNGVGLIKMLTREVSASTAIQPYWKSQLQVLPVEDESTASNVILGSEIMKNMIEQATKHYDRVIVDTAPIQVSNDASVFAREGGTLLLVVSQNVGQRKALREAVHEVKVARIKIGGVVFNRVAHERSRKGNYYYYEQSETDAKNGKRKTHKTAQGAKYSGSAAVAARRSASTSVEA
ncbi:MULTISPECIES: polysaccharide biosynthesis tyrosine autokinase [unclassified Bifidobacterium]|uniref:polysaccharide biosynthesis tyrosine autokinase n=1 Tax=unclassified Bifidobacterium TaxID=2608897 RepID=UPI001127CC67|nr:MULTISPECIES: polysaccharide biosynthesis tyrosine autokinase [unclassified Bifidobacterium]TPF78566.1 chain-length determining protein [Bifidobacterium sp. UTCIF-1]TPF80847.1 chain-length determining protein [Bifidobacterium sp. UTCIF-24]TPF82714.1 chain-length determining protein [Bifidobacterium sp. UTCIF-3]TPF84512.1 chain-length determining protein [Bifidobacterium sp. UTCIF-36]TPF90927.1 chain-length determining protein [Bifidobacterium sp. UTBIF-56]